MEKYVINKIELNGACHIFAVLENELINLK